MTFGCVLVDCICPVCGRKHRKLIEGGHTTETCRFAVTDPDGRVHYYEIQRNARKRNGCYLISCNECRS